MRVTIDTVERTLIVESDARSRKIGLYTREAFELLSTHWIGVGWDLKYSYTFTWLGRPIIQLPEDLLRLQEVVYRVKPDVIIETGVAHGGSLIFHASMCKLLDRGRVIGVDIEIHARNRVAIEEHQLSPWIRLIEGSSTNPGVVAQVRSHLKDGEVVLVILDSCHSKAHVLQELEAYYPLVTPGSYILATDGITRDLCQVPHGEPDWCWDNPAAAATEFARSHPEFLLEQPAWLFNESQLRENVTYWPQAWLRRVA